MRSTVTRRSYSSKRSSSGVAHGSSTTASSSTSTQHALGDEARRRTSVVFAGSMPREGLGVGPRRAAPVGPGRQQQPRAHDVARRAAERLDGRQRPLDAIAACA